MSVTVILLINYTNLEGVVLIFGIYYLINFIPTVLLHIEYYLINLSSTLKINNENQVITLNEILDVNFGNIEKIILYMPPIWYRSDHVMLFPFENYRFAVIKLKSGKVYIVTCLMVFEIEKMNRLITQVRTEKKKRLIASPLIERLFS
jgi:hypothetical protein